MLTMMTRSRMLRPFSLRTASAIGTFSEIATYAQLGETPATKSLIRRTFLTSIPDDSTQVVNSISLQLCGTFAMKRVAIFVPPQRKPNLFPHSTKVQQNRL